MMKTYAKPMVLTNDELAEGVYAASGDGEGRAVNFTGGPSEDVSLEGNKKKRYIVTLQSNSSEVANGFTMVIKFQTPARFVSGSGFTCTGGNETTKVSLHSDMVVPAYQSPTFNDIVFESVDGSELLLDRTPPFVAYSDN